mmetsp:Transcript_1791/g.3954  ORF Transcript_1791/g.3954 Transcript_1791/m.3954 type:complete len:164 (-) Transcript_1791:160-651(-)
MVLLDESAFLVRLGELYENNHTSGTVYLQMKRFAGRLASVRRHKIAKQAEAAEGQELRCLVRARSNNKKVKKISTMIDAKDMVRFQMAIGNILRLHMNLKRPEKKKPKEAKQKDKAAGGANKPVKKDAPEKGKEAAAAPASSAAPPASAPAGGKKEGSKKKGK